MIGKAELYLTKQQERLFIGIHTRWQDNTLMASLDLDGLEQLPIKIILKILMQLG
jgi:hypothetical protein